MAEKKEAGADPGKEDPQQAKVKALLAQLGLTPEILQGMLAPIIKQTMVDILKGSALEKTAIEFQEMKATLGPVLEQIKAAGQGGAAASAAGPGQAAPAGDPLGSAILQFLMQKMAPSGGTANPLDSLAATLQSVQKIAELANAPYSQGRRDALSETNDMLRLLTGAGAPADKRTKVLADTIARELGAQESGGGDGTGE